VFLPPWISVVKRDGGVLQQLDPELNNKQATLTELVVVPSSVDVSGKERIN
jgi:hypothetical protein